jgi:hypothetical protein
MKESKVKAQPTGGLGDLAASKGLQYNIPTKLHECGNSGSGVQNYTWIMRSSFVLSSGEHVGGEFPPGFGSAAGKRIA